MASRYVFDAQTADFQTAVIQRSLEVPILIDFWAEWCGPCKTLGPVLDEVAEEYGGAFLVAKVDVDAEPALAQAFGAQSIPLCFLVSEGRPLDSFTGAVDGAALRKLLGKHGVQPLGAEPEAPAELDPDSPEGRLGRAREAILANSSDLAREALKDFPEEHESAGEAANLEAGLAWLEAELPETPVASSHLEAARACLLAGRVEDTLEAIVDSAREDRSYGDGLARRAMMLCQALWPDQADLVDEYRRRLATLLY